jgi:NAD(P)-dependent dehydrogenase (short-subunit alcohol dehydrogenase family)
MLSMSLRLGSCFLSLCVHCCVSSFFLFVNALGFIYGHFLKYFGSKVQIDCERHAVVITGCDSGFGEMTSRRLQIQGFHVITVCITPEGAQRLTGVVSLSIVGDVTKEKDIANLVTQVEDYLGAKKVKLWGVVCNAGIGNSGAVDWMSTQTFRKVIEVNFFGVVNVTKALLPLLKKNKGSRIVNLSSVAGFLSAPMMAAYDASKHAVEGYAKALRTEMKPWNIHVSNVNPGFMRYVCGYFSLVDF